MQNQLSYSIHEVSYQMTENDQTTDRMTDPIIQEMLSKRSISDNVNAADEPKRQNQMYHMLVHSKKYQKLSIQRANDLWDREIVDTIINTVDVPNDCEFYSSSSDRHVHFSDKIEYIPYIGSKSEHWKDHAIRKLRSLFRL